MKKTILMLIVAASVATVPALAWKNDAPVASESAQPRIEVVFVLDTTGSMSGLIAAAKEKIWSIANTLATAQPAPQIEMGLVGYRDRGDAYVTKHLALTEDLDAVHAFLMGFQAGGGGDGPESVNQALHEAVTKMDWSTDEQTYRVIFLVGDFPPHMDYSDDVKYPQSCKRAAERGITINTIQCGAMPLTTPIWAEIARKAEGEFFRVEQSGGAIVASTPFDAELGVLSRDLDGTRIYYGSAEEMALQMDREQVGAALYEGASSQAIAARVIFNASAAGKDNFAGGKELVDDLVSGRVVWRDLKDEELSEAVRKMSLPEREAHVKKMTQRRAQLHKQIAELSAQRQAHIKGQIQSAGHTVKDSLDVQLYECIKNQAQKKRIVYTEGPRY